MKRIVLFSLPSLRMFAWGTLLCMMVACNAVRVAGDTDKAGCLIIFYQPETGKAPLLEAARDYGSEVLYQYQNFNCVAVTVPGNKTVAKAIRYYKKVRGVLEVTEDKAQQLHRIP